MMRSFLVADIGIAYTRTIMIDVVEGQYRLISGAMTRTTITAPDAQVKIGLYRDVQQLQTQTGRVMMGEKDLIVPTQRDGSGVDVFIVTASSAGRPLRAVLAALMDDFSLVSAKRALTGTYIEAVETLSLNDIQSEETRINTILRHAPDVVFIAGGTNDGNEEAVRSLIRLVELAIRLEPAESRPIVLYAGNERLRPWVKARLEDYCVTFTSDNIRPSLEEENLNSAKLKLAQVFDNFLKHQPGGFSEVSDMSDAGIIPSAQSVGRLIRYLDSLSDNGAMYVDIGSGTSTLITSLSGETTADIRSTLGLGHSVLAVLDVLDWRDVERWLPFQFSLDAFEEWAHNKALAPLTIPQTLRELFIEHAVAREIVRFLLTDTNSEWALSGRSQPTFSPIIVGGAVFTANTPPSLAAMLILDALQPTGVVDIWLDPYALASALGAISFAEPVALVQVVDNGGFARLGTVFCPEGQMRVRARMKVKITLPTGDVIQHQVGNGEFWVADISPGTWVDVDVRVSRGLRLNGKRRYRGRLQAGTAGLVFDLRGRPLSIPSGRRRRRVVASWFKTATGIEIDEAALEAEAEAQEQVAALARALAAGVGEEDFPEYKKLPDAPLDAEFASLLSVDDVELEFPDEFSDEAGEADSLARELGLR